MGFSKRQGSSGPFFARFFTTIKRKGRSGKEYTINISHPEVPQGHEVRSSLAFIKTQRAVSALRSRKLNELGIKGTKAAKIKTLFRLRKSASMLAEDSHISACTKETALLLSRFVKQELSVDVTSKEVNPVIKSYLNSGLGEAISRFKNHAEELEKNALSSKSQTDERFAGEIIHPLTRSLEEVIRDAEFALRGRATTGSQIIPSGQMFFSFVNSLADARLKAELGMENYKILKQAVAEKRKSGQ